MTIPIGGTDRGEVESYGKARGEAMTVGHSEGVSYSHHACWSCGKPWRQLVSDAFRDCPHCGQEFATGRHESPVYEHPDVLGRLRDLEKQCREIKEQLRRMEDDGR